ncbi:hypothetical protein OG271_14720 [Micromonospora rifamycinica]|uniref:hypothetical protein n=1 Tax=Micromonospora rifamycinica TaxID=291594 RepID=UPI002E2C1EC5|nr:hypothetical protein [Micromonospora rifamycinica]
MARLWSTLGSMIRRFVGGIARGLVSVGEAASPVPLTVPVAPRVRATRPQPCLLRYGSLASPPRRAARRPPGRGRIR